MRTIILLFLFLSQAAYSCSPLFKQNFRPFMESSLFNPKKEPKIPIATLKIVRAKTFVSSCQQPSFLEIEIENTELNYSAGYIFKFKSAPIKGLTFPDEPVVSNSLMYFSFIWLESEAELKKTIEATVEIVAVLPNGKKSEPTYVNVVSPINYH